MNPDRWHPHPDIVWIYLPRITSAESQKAEQRLRSVEERYLLPGYHVRQIVGSYHDIFCRLIRIDPVLRRQKPGREPFAINVLKKLTRAEAKAELRKLRLCFARNRVPRFEQRNYLQALEVHAYEMFQRIQAQIQMEVDKPSLL